MLRKTLVAAVLIVVSCRFEAPDKAARNWVASDEVALEAVDARSQYELAAAVARARRPPVVELTSGQRTAEAEAVEAPADPLAAVARAWNGRRYRWSLRYVPALCVRADACRLLPFDHEQTGEWTQGWLPQVRIEAETHRRLGALCAPYERCVVEVEGRLDLSLKPGLPPMVALAAVQLNHARAVRADESWVRRRPRRWANR